MPGGLLDYRFNARYGGIDLHVESWTVNRSRSLIVHMPARGRGAQLSDRSRVPRVDTLSVRLVGTPAQVTEARDILASLENSGAARRFEHPIDGQWLARLSDFHEQVDAGGAVFSMVLTEDQAAETRAQTTLREERGSLQKTEAAIEIYAQRRESLRQTSPALADDLIEPPAMQVPVRNWDGAPGQQIALDVEDIRGRSDASLDRLGGLLDPDAHETAIALLQARAELDRYAQTLRGAQRTAAIALSSDRSLMRVLVDLYGARRANELIDNVIRTNSIRDPLRLQAGSVLQLPVL